jgi:aminopeptidase-like protein
MYSLMERLWPICRSITGPGVRETLAILREHVSELQVHELPTGTRCFDWSVPREWRIRSARLEGPDGTVLADFDWHNLHVVNYSTPIDVEVSLEELQPHLHSIPEQPDAIPYVTSYYRETWGFCIAHRVREQLRPGRYRARIESELVDGSLTYGEIRLPGKSEREVMFSTYICHPSMANNELSGPCLTAELACWLRAKERRHTYRLLFLPETIGAICYLSRHLDEMKARIVAGFVVTCVGDERAWSFMPSRDGDTLSDRAARHVLRHFAPGYVHYTFLERGSDERQYCSPGVDLPVCSIMRSKYGTYPEYHTSLDDLSVVSPRGLEGSLTAHQRVVEVLEGDCVPRVTVLGEPKMSDRGLRSTTGKRGSADASRTLMNLLAYSDGRRTLLEIADVIGAPAWELGPHADMLARLGLLDVEPLG